MNMKYIPWILPTSFTKYEAITLGQLFVEETCNQRTFREYLRKKYY